MFKRKSLSIWPGLFIGIFVAIYLLFYPIASHAQQFSFHSVGAEVSSSQCYCVLQDSKGYIWFSSDKGLYKYDGNTFKCFNSDNGLPRNSVFQLCEDSKGRILFNTLQGTVGYVYHDSIVFPPFNQKLQKALNHGRNIIFDIYTDSNHILWITTYGALYKTLKPNDYSDIEAVQSKCVDSCRVFIKIIDNKKALYSLAIEHGKLKANNLFLHTGVNTDKKNFVIPYTINVLNGNPSQFSTILLSNGTILWDCLTDLYIIQPDGNFTIKKTPPVLFMYQDKTGGVWLGTYKKGVYYYKDASLTGVPIISLPDISVSSIMEDGENGIWVSTLEKGIFYTNSKLVLDYSKHEGLNDKISSIGIIGNKLLVNNYNNFITVIQDTSITKIVPQGGCNFSAVFDYYLINHKVYVTGSPSTLQTDTLFKQWKQIAKNRVTVHLNGIAISPSGEIFGIIFAQLCKLEGDSLISLDFLPARGKCIYYTREGELLIGTVTGLYRYDNGTYTSISQGTDLPFANGQSILENKDGNVWVITYGKGIFIYKNDKIIRTITTKDGLASNYVQTVTFDSAGNAWAGTDNGISRISVPGYSIESFDMRHGFISNIILNLAIDGNNLWIGTGSGLCMVNIDSLKKNNIPPKVYISSVSVNDSVVKHAEDFSHGFNNFKFHLQALTYKDNITRFTYRLLGLDTAWHLSNSSDVVFTSLPPGNYHFEVRAMNADGIASVQSAMFSFTILSPFWKTWWFILLEILLTGASIYLFIRYRLNLIQAREKEKTEFNKMISEYQMTALRAQMNPHFVFNAINSIQQFVLDNEAEQAYDFLTRFAQLIRMVLNNAKEKSVSLEVELETMETYVKLEQLRFGNKFDFILDVDKNADLYNIHLPAMIIQPYLENAIWHGLMPLGDLRRGMLTLRIIQNGNELTITIEDNGIGREKSALIKKTKKHKSVGMELTKQRIDMLNSLPEYASSSILIYDLHDEKGTVAGTRVEIKIITKTE